MDKKPIFEVLENDEGQRLDNYLLKHRKHIEKSNWYKLIRKGLVRVNGKRVKPLYKLSKGDFIRIPPSIYFVATKKVSVDSTLQTDLMQHVIFEDTNYLVINKPAGLAVHAGTGHKMGVIETLTSIVGYENLQLAHRLDKDTSGCLLLAKNRKALLNFQSAMKKHQVIKIYLAIVVGVMSEVVVVNQPLDTDNRVKGIRTVKISKQGKSAKTTFTPLLNNGQYSLVECAIESGRTHQIRVHAQYLGKPIVGDALYGDGRCSHGRALFLHAKTLQFDAFVFEAPMPHELTAFLG